jgi:cyanophycinase
MFTFPVSIPFKSFAFMKNSVFLLLALCLAACESDKTEDMTSVTESRSGKLFIIGGGHRSLELMREVCELSGLGPEDAVGILPMASEEPDSAFVWSSARFTELGFNCLNLNPELPENAEDLEEKMRACKLLFVSGGDQNLFMEKARKYGLDKLIAELYQTGTSISGTSAGAAVMSEVMITGDQRFEPVYESTYSRLLADNGIYSRGLGLLKGVVVDQHFITRSRYNRALSALCDFPNHAVWGVEERTAAVVWGDSLGVIGSEQVVVFYPVADCDTSNQRLGIREAKMRVLLQGEKMRFR